MGIVGRLQFVEVASLGKVWPLGDAAGAARWRYQVRKGFHQEAHVLGISAGETSRAQLGEQINFLAAFGPPARQMEMKIEEHARQRQLMLRRRPMLDLPAERFEAARRRGFRQRSGA